MKKLIAVLLVAASLVSVLGFTVYAAKSDRFHESVEAKHHPDVVPPDSKDKPGIDAEIVDEEGNVVIDVPNGELIITPYSKADEAKYKEITDSLHGAYNSILNAKSLSELNEGLDAEAKKYGDKYTADSLIARMMFNVYVTGSYREALDADENNYLKVTFDLGLKNKSRTPIMMVTPDGTVWDLNQADFVTRNADNTITVKMYDVGTVTFFYFKDDESIDTGDFFMLLILILLVIGMVVSGTAIVINNRKKRVK